MHVKQTATDLMTNIVIRNTLMVAAQGSTFLIFLKWFSDIQHVFYEEIHPLEGRWETFSLYSSLCIACYEFILILWSVELIVHHTLNELLQTN